MNWSDPTVQGAIIAGVISLAGVVLAAIAGVAGAVAGARIGAGAMRAEGERQRQAEAARRLREWNLLRIEHTRTQLVSIADGFVAIMDEDLRRARAHLAAADTVLLANARLVGDVEALSSMARAVVDTMSALPSNAVVRLFRLVATNPFDDGQRNAMRSARAELLTALETAGARTPRRGPCGADARAGRKHPRAPPRRRGLGGSAARTTIG
jgi:hypothetical protein